jgi:hypothetical protein
MPDKKKKLPSLPKRVMVIPNPDKSQNEKWTPERKMDNFPTPNRFILCGRPGCGKTLVLMNILMRQRPMYEVLILVHPDGEISQEWKDFEPTIVMSEPPPPSFFESLVKEDGTFPKTAVVCDDLEIFKTRKDIISNITTLMRYYSTHRFVSTYLTYQSFFDIENIFRKLASVFLIWRPMVVGELNAIEKRCGLEDRQLRYLFDKYCHEPTDFITIDQSQGSPAPLRFGLFQKITMEKKRVGSYWGDEDEAFLASDSE